MERYFSNGFLIPSDKHTNNFLLRNKKIIIISNQPEPEPARTTTTTTTNTTTTTTTTTTITTASGADKKVFYFKS